MRYGFNSPKSVKDKIRLLHEQKLSARVPITRVLLQTILIRTRSVITLCFSNRIGHISIVWNRIILCLNNTFMYDIFLILLFTLIYRDNFGRRFIDLIQYSTLRLEYRCLPTIFYSERTRFNNEVIKRRSRVK